MSRPIVLVLLVLVLGGGLAAYALLGGEGSGTDRRGRTSSISLEPIPGRPLEAAQGVVSTPELVLGSGRDEEASAGLGTSETTVVHPLQVELSLASRALLPRPEDGMPYRAGAVAGIEGRVAGLDGRPAAGARIDFLQGPNQGRVLVADTMGRYGATDLWEGLSVVRISVGVISSERPARLRRLARTPVSVDFSATAYVGVLVVDAMGKPIEGAEVRVDGVNRYTDLQGRAGFERVTLGKVSTSVHKPGFARQQRDLHFSRGVVPDENKYVLRRGASLAVHVAHYGGSGPPAKLFLMPGGGSGGPGGQTLREFPWHEVSPIEIPIGRTVQIDDLPEDVVQLRLFHPGSIAQPPVSHQRLHAGVVTQAELMLAGAPALMGQVVREGKPVSGAQVTLEASDRDRVSTASLDRKPMFAEEIVLPHSPVAFQETVTDARGRFVLTGYPGVEEGRYLVAQTPDGRWRGARLVRGVGDEVTVELQEVPEVGGNLVLDLPGRFQALPVEVRVDGRPRDPVLLRPGEDLRIEDLEHGTWRLHATWEGEDVISRREVRIEDGVARAAGTLPEGAIAGQPLEVRQRVLAARKELLGVE
jgi:hypothetical protein